PPMSADPAKELHANLDRIKTAAERLAGASRGLPPGPALRRQLRTLPEQKACTLADGLAAHLGAGEERAGLLEAEADGRDQQPRPAPAWKPRAGQGGPRPLPGSPLAGRTERLAPGGA